MRKIEKVKRDVNEGRCPGVWWKMKWHFKTLWSGSTGFNALETRLWNDAEDQNGVEQDVDGQSGTLRNRTERRGPGWNSMVRSESGVWRLGVTYDPSTAVKPGLVTLHLHTGCLHTQSPRVVQTSSLAASDVTKNKNHMEAQKADNTKQTHTCRQWERRTISTVYGLKFIVGGWRGEGIIPVLTSHTKRQVIDFLQQKHG